MAENIFDTVISFVSPKIAAARQKARVLERHYQSLARKYEAASTGRRTKNWKTSATSANTEVGTSLTEIRNRARALVRDNPYAAGAVQTIVSNTIGTGVVAEAKKNKKTAKSIQTIWDRWAGTTECDADGLSNFYAMQALAFRTVVESGECLIRRRRRRSTDDLTVPLQLQVLEPDFLDTAKSETLSGGGRIIHGVEFNATGKRVAYWLFDEHPGENGLAFRSSFQSKRVRASEIIHLFDPLRPGQVRAVSWFAPIMLTLRDFDELQFAQLTRQKIAACFTGFIHDIDNSLDGSAEDEELENLEPGAVMKLPAGKNITFANPPGVPGYSEYSKTILHGIARGLGVTYEALTGDLSQVNFSSGRMGRLEYQRNIEQWRWNLLIPRFCEPVWSWFMEAAELAGAKVTGIDVVWTPPKREMIDPTKEVPATIKAVRAGLTSLSEAIRESGNDPRQLMEEIKSDNDTIDELGLILDSDARNVMTSGSVQPTVIDDIKKDNADEN